ncbi:MAG TPA: type II toxin-antitoxin system death-on-curing family toxin [Chitinophagaceae bacterium]|nr:type II toxin-antitoxin system death-on-curing family toxin [Chitinophagaceae bacterium]
MFNITTVLLLHNEVLKQYGGAAGMRDAGLLDSALNRPFQTFSGEDLYPGVFEKAAAIIESVILNHPFIDGNKRTGFLLCTSFLLDYDIYLVATEDDRYNFVINISTGGLSFEEIVTWLQENTEVK